MAPAAALATLKVRNRLRRRPPGPVRSARALFGFWLFCVVASGTALVVAALVLKVGAAWTLLPSLAGSLVVGIIGFAAAREFRNRSRAALALAVLVAVAGGADAVATILVATSSSSGLDGNVAFGFGVGGAFRAVLFGSILWHLVRGRAWFLQRDADALAVATAATILSEAESATEAAGAPADRPLYAWSGGGVPALEPMVPAAGATPAAAAARGDDPLISVRGLKKHFPILGGVLRHQIGTIYAVDGVDFDIFRGEVFSLVGESGCGKTTLGRTVLQLTPPTAGKVVFDGYELEDVDDNDMRPLRRRMQIIFQDPFGSLNPRMPVSDIIGEGLLAQGITDRRERDKRVEDALEIVGLRRDYTRRYPHEFSGGQRQRIGVARALALNPDFIVCDEPVSALDVSIQSQVLNLLLDLRRDFDLTYLFISHNLSVVEYFSDRVGVMYLGKLVEVATVEELYAGARHPYSVALLSAIPNPDPRKRHRRLVLAGDVPSPAAPPPGCRFHTRCWLRERLGNPEICSSQEPALAAVNGTAHQVACHFSDEVAGAVADATTAGLGSAEASGSATA